MVLENAVRCVDIWSEEFKVEWMQMDPKAYTNFFHIAAPGMQNDHRLLEPLVNFAKANGAEFMFETKAISLIVNQENAVVGVRLQDQVTNKYQDIRAKKVLLATGDWVSNQEMVAKYLPKWEGLPMTTYTSMGDGVEMATTIGAGADQDGGTLEPDVALCAYGRLGLLQQHHPRLARRKAARQREQHPFCG